MGLPNDVEHLQAIAKVMHREAVLAINSCLPVFERYEGI